MILDVVAPDSSVRATDIDTRTGNSGRAPLVVRRGGLRRRSGPCAAAWGRVPRPARRVQMSGVGSVGSHPPSHRSRCRTSPPRRAVQPVSRRRRARPGSGLGRALRHADLGETAAMLAIQPELVRLERAQAGFEHQDQAARQPGWRSTRSAAGEARCRTRHTSCSASLPPAMTRGPAAVPAARTSGPRPPADRHTTGDPLRPRRLPASRPCAPSRILSRTRILWSCFSRSGCGCRMPTVRRSSRT
jgi:hypothetical protein